MMELACQAGQAMFGSFPSVTPATSTPVKAVALRLEWPPTVIIVSLMMIKVNIAGGVRVCRRQIQTPECAHLDHQRDLLIFVLDGHGAQLHAMTIN